MVEQNPEDEQDKKEMPKLPADFYRELLDLPTCKTKGTCSQCGRCEH